MPACSFLRACAIAGAAVCATSVGVAVGQVVVQPGVRRPVVVQPGVVIHPQLNPLPPYPDWYRAYVQPHPRGLYPPYAPYPSPSPYVPNQWWDVYRPYPQPPWPSPYAPKSFCMPLRAPFIVSTSVVSYQPVVSATWNVLPSPVVPYAVPQFPAMIAPNPAMIAPSNVAFWTPPYVPYAPYPPYGVPYSGGVVPVGGAVVRGYYLSGGMPLVPVVPIAQPGQMVIYPGPSGLIPWIPPGY